MADRRLDDLYHAAMTGKLSRRQVLKRAAALGLTAPVIGALLAACGGSAGTAGAATSTTGGAAATSTTSGSSGAAGGTPAAASGTATTGSTPVPTGTRGQGGQVKLLWWEAPTILNGHLSQGTKDYDASRVASEPLADFDTNGNLVPILASEVPSMENGGLAKDGTSVTWKLLQGVTWSDGQPFTSADVKFTYDYVTNKDTAAVTIGSYLNITSLETPDDHTVVIHFNAPTPNWFAAFCGNQGYILPQHVLQNFVGKAARNAPFNLKPIGTGGFVVTDFVPGDHADFAVNDKYRVPNRPYFATVSLKGGGDAVSAARACIQTGEVDYAWNLQVSAEVLKSLASSNAPGQTVIYPGTGVERILINQTDPNTEVDGQKSHVGTPHPFQADLKVRQAYALMIQRDVMATKLYGPGGQATANLLVEPPKFASKNTSWKYDLAAAGKLLDDEGWKKGSDGIRAKDGKQMAVVFQTTVNDLRQQEQEIVKAAFDAVGIKMRLKSTDASVFFASDAGNPDTAAHFYADLEMFTNTASTPYPLDYMRSWWGDPTNVCQKSNQWAGSNYDRWINPDFDAAYKQALTEMDEKQQAQLFIKMNDLVVNDVASIAEVWRNNVSAAAKTLDNLNLSTWASSELWNLSNWTRKA